MGSREREKLTFYPYNKLSYELPAFNSLDNNISKGKMLIIKYHSLSCQDRKDLTTDYNNNFLLLAYPR